MHELDDCGADWHASRTKQGAASAQEVCWTRSLSLIILPTARWLLEVTDA